MSNTHYPQIDLTMLMGLTSVWQQMQVNEKYLTARACPYDEEVRSQLAKMFAPRIIEVEKEAPVDKGALAEKAAEGGKTGPKLKTSGVDMDAVSQEIQDIRRELQQLKIDSKGLQTSDKIQIIKTRAGLVEKLVAMDERTNTLKKSSLFQSTILNILDDLVPQDRRMEFIKRIQPFAADE